MSKSIPTCEYCGTPVPGADTKRYTRRFCGSSCANRSRQALAASGPALPRRVATDNYCKACGGADGWHWNGCAV